MKTNKNKEPQIPEDICEETIENLSNNKGDDGDDEQQ